MDLAPRPALRHVRPCVLVCVLALLSAMPVWARADEAPRTVASVDLDRYAGEWFEIARFPNRFQRECVGNVRASYARRDDGRIDVRNRCTTDDGGEKDARGVARVVDTATNARLKVRFAPAAVSFLPFVWGDYWILGLSPDYTWALVGSPDREYLWILARTASLSDADWKSAIAIAQAAAFDTTRLVRTSQAGTPAE